MKQAPGALRPDCDCDGAIDSPAVICECLPEECNGLDDECDCPGDTNGDSVPCGPGDDGVDEEPLPGTGLPRGTCSPPFAHRLERSAENEDPGAATTGGDRRRLFFLVRQSCVQYTIGMPVHLNITLDEDLYRRLKASTRPKKLSAFIGDAIKARLGPARDELDQAYRTASRERWRGRLAGEWAATDTEAWPE